MKHYLFLTFWCLFCTCFFSSQLAAQQYNITFRVFGIPESTPKADTIYIVGKFNEWNPSDPRYALSKGDDGIYSITLLVQLDTFEYKFTRGGWGRVEGEVNGEVKQNRRYSHRTDGGLVNVSIVSWEDLDRKPISTYVLLVHRVPESTPHDATLYAAGNFNNWQPNDPNYKLVKDANDIYSVTFKSDLQQIEYKFTRGNWKSVEGRSDGRSLNNRRFDRRASPNINNIVIKSEVETWEDIDGAKFHAYTFILLLAAFQGFLLVIAISTMQDNNRKANMFLIMLIVLTSVAVMAKAGTFQRYIFEQQPKIFLLSDIALFIYAPLFWIYVKKLFTGNSEYRRFDWLMLAPALVQLLFYFPMIFTDNQSFINNVVAGQYRELFKWTGLIALFFNLFVWWRCVRLVKGYQKSASENYSFEHNLSYMGSVIVIQGFCLLFWFLAYVAGAVEVTVERPLSWAVETAMDILWVLFSGTTYVLGYYAMNQPEILKIRSEPAEIVLPVVGELVFQEIKKPVSQEVAKPISGVIPKDELEKYKKDLNKLMETDKPYMNQKLTLAELAEMMHTNVHTLSRVINEGYQKNFYDFVNDYRVHKFVELANSPKFKNHTFLAVAMEVGFSSKTAFNRAFKKATGTTPSSYFNDDKRDKE